MIPLIIILACLDVFVLLSLLLLRLRLWASVSDLRKAITDVRENLEQTIPKPLAIAELVLREVNINFRCPQCQGLLSPGTKFCRHCGTDIKAVKRARLLGCKWDGYNSRYIILWQCTQCGSDKEIYWHKSDFEKYGPFIHLLKCSTCGHVGDALINPKEWTPTKPWLITVSDPGTLKLENPEDLTNAQDAVPGTCDQGS